MEKEWGQELSVKWWEEGKAMYKGEGERPEREGGKELLQRAVKHGAERTSSSELQEGPLFEGLQENLFQLCYFLLDLLTVSLAILPYKTAWGNSTASLKGKSLTCTVVPGQENYNWVAEETALGWLCKVILGLHN